MGFALATSDAVFYVPCRVDGNAGQPLDTTLAQLLEARVNKGLFRPDGYVQDMVMILIFLLLGV